MPKVTFKYGGQVRVIETEAGQSLLQIALDNGIPMENACGGNGFCTTCLCKVREGGPMGPRTEREEDMGVTEDPERLGCQATVEADVTIEIVE